MFFMKKAKKVISCILALLLISITPVTAFASYSNLGEQYQFVYPDGTTIFYYLEDSGLPYRFINGEKVYVALALPHLMVKDESQIKALERSSNMGIALADSSSDVFDLRNCAADHNSIDYVATAYLANSSIFETKTLLYNRSHTGLKINTNKHKPLWASNNINFIYYFYHEAYNRWYSLTFVDKNCTYGFAFQHSPSIYPKGYFKILATSTLESCEIRIHTGPYLPAGGVPIH